MSLCVSDRLGRIFLQGQAPSASSTLDSASGGPPLQLFGHFNEFKDAQRRCLDANEHRRATAEVLVDEFIDQSSFIDIEGTFNQSDSETF
ncbi:unnamed protein product [Rotaria sp. Silwood1]|nr:unnamed protein product [Rotaria sp. Silwood1]CAF3590001.1 unnamed protein product [Rotaria sp. Silwood1]CAF3820757.1 unnamed protein product [Rotaria sp. Silwood1]CAF4946446.1 unnamed protein product [Rotaria sp. Silwood1]